MCEACNTWSHQKLKVIHSRQCFNIKLYTGSINCTVTAVELCNKLLDGIDEIEYGPTYFIVSGVNWMKIIKKRTIEPFQFIHVANPCYWTQIGGIQQ